MAEGTSLLAGAISLEDGYGERLLIMLGWRIDIGVAFDAVTMSKVKSFEELETLFSPRRPGPGNYVVLDNSIVYITTKAFLGSFIKYPIIDINVNRIDPLQKPTEIITPPLNGRIVERPPQNRSDGLYTPWRRP